MTSAKPIFVQSNATRMSFSGTTTEGSRGSFSIDLGNSEINSVIILREEIRRITNSEI